MLGLVTAKLFNALKSNLVRILVYMQRMPGSLACLEPGSILLKWVLIHY